MSGKHAATSCSHGWGEGRLAGSLLVAANLLGIGLVGTQAAPASVEARPPVTVSDLDREAATTAHEASQSTCRCGTRAVLQ